jgi:hypothetical protein
MFIKRTANAGIHTAEERWKNSAKIKEKKTFRVVLVSLRRIQRWCLCQGRHQPNSLLKDTPEIIKLGTKGEKGGEDRRQGKNTAGKAPLQSGRTTDMTLAPQLVSLTEKSPFLSSYTPTIFLVASAGPVASAQAARHSSSARNCSCLAIGVAASDG